MIDQTFDEEQFDFKTNCLLAFDVELTNGQSSITFRVTDRAGNIATTNFVVTLDYSGVTEPPTVQVDWPPDVALISGTSFTVRGMLDDDTASVSAEIVDGSDNTNFVAGVVERGGKFWVENIPLPEGDSQVTLAVTNAAGIGMRAALAVSKSDLNLTVSTPQDESLYEGRVAVWGSIDALNYSIVVNGVEATDGYEYDGIWYWSAQDVPVRGLGTATFDVEAYPPDGGAEMMGAFSMSSLAGSSQPVTTSLSVEMPAKLAIVEYRVSKTRDAPEGNEGSNLHYTRVKKYTEEHKDNAPEPASFHGTATDRIEKADNSWEQNVYDWTGSAKTAHHTDSDGGDTTYPSIGGDDFKEITGVPDEDCSHIGSLPYTPPSFVYHYYAAGVHHRKVNSDGTVGAATVKARTRHVLYTGGKALLKRKSLFRITVKADQYGEPPATPWLDTPPTPLDPIAAKMKVLGWWIFRKQLDGSGDVYVALSDNSQKDLNLNIPGVKHYYAQASVQKIRLDLSSVAFESTAGNILVDTTGEEYSAPHFLLNGAGQTVYSLPVLYVSGSHVKTYATFANRALSESGPGGEFPLIFKGEVSGGNTSFTLWGNNDGNVTDQDSVTLYADNPLTANRVDYFKPMTIKWYYGYLDEPDYIYAGTSSNAVYVSLAPPTTANLFHTVVHLACSKSGATTANAAVANTWSLFEGPANVRTWNGTPLTYYGTPDGGLCTDTATLLRTHDGQCGSFAELLTDSFRANGILDAAITLVEPPPGHDAFGVKNIGFSGTSFPPDYKYATADLDTTVPGLPGQNTDPPLAKLFGIHYIVHRGSGSAYYDPSYGVTSTSAANYSSNIGVWRRASDGHWRDASGSGLVLIFTDLP